jgi:geranylgeranyl diphosphate synthase type I
MDTYTLMRDVFLASNAKTLQAWPEMAGLFKRAAARRPREWQLPATACEAAGGRAEQAVSAAAAFACAQISIILIDDLLDDDPRGEYRVIGAGAAANLAAAFQAAALDILGEDGQAGDPATRLAAWRSLNRMLLTTALGQRLDSQNPADEASYWTLVETKSAPFYGAAFQLGALAAGASAERAERFAQLGRLYGAMIQIHDDLNDAMAVPAKPDWTQGRACLPILFAQNVDHPQRERFKELRRALQRAPDAKALAEAQAILIRCGAISYGLHELLRRHQYARALLAPLGVEPRAGLEPLFEDLVQPVRRVLAEIGRPPAAEFSPVAG